MPPATAAAEPMAMAEAAAAVSAWTAAAAKWRLTKRRVTCDVVDERTGGVGVSLNKTKRLLVDIGVSSTLG